MTSPLTCSRRQVCSCSRDHKIARASFLVPDNCRKVSPRAFLRFLEQKGRLASVSEIER